MFYFSIFLWHEQSLSDKLIESGWVINMFYSIEEIAFWTSILILVSIIGSKIASRYGIPAILLFLVLGMLTGSDGPGGIPFDDPYITEFLGIIALAYIIFAGALSTNWKSIRPVLWSGISLSTLAVVITALLIGGIIHIVFKLSFLKGLLLGAIVSSTDAAAVFSILRSRKMGLKYNLKPLLELESGSNDPAAVILTMGILKILTTPESAHHALMTMFIWQIISGIFFGYGMGRLLIHTFNKLKLEHEGLYPVLSFGSVLFIYSITTFAGGSGFLAVYVAGLILGNSNIFQKSNLLSFHDGFSWLMQIIMFLVFGLFVFPKKLIPVMWPGLFIAVFIIFIARPVSVFISLLFSKMNIKEKTMISWVGLRGATPMILATIPFLNDIPKADMLFHLVFFIVLVSIFIQAPTIPIIAKWLGMAKREDE